MFLKSLHTIHTQSQISFSYDNKCKYITVTVLLKFEKTVKDKYPALISFEFIDKDGNIITDSDCSFSKEYGFYKYIASHGYNGIYDYTSVIKIPKECVNLTCSLIGLYCKNMTILDDLRILTTENTIFDSEDKTSIKIINEKEKKQIEKSTSILVLGKQLLGEQWANIRIIKNPTGLKKFFTSYGDIKFAIITDDYCTENNIFSIKLSVAFLKKKNVKIVLWDLSLGDKQIYSDIASLVDVVFCNEYEKVSLYKNFNILSYFLPKGVSNEQIISSCQTFENEKEYCHTFDDITNAALNHKIPVQKENNYSRTFQVIFGDFLQNERNISYSEQKSNALYRKVLLEHTILDRFNYICQKLSLKKINEKPIVLLISCPRNKSSLRTIIEHYNRQNYPQIKKYVVVRSKELKQYAEDNFKDSIKIVSNMKEIFHAYKNMDNVFISYIEESNFYSSNYITDLVLGHKISCCSGILSSCYFEKVIDNGIKTAEKYKCYALTREVELDRSLLEFSLFFKIYKKCLKNIDGITRIDTDLFINHSYSFIKNSAKLPLYENVRLSKDININCGISFDDVDSQNANIKPRLREKKTVFKVTSDVLIKDCFKNTDKINFENTNKIINIHSSMSSENSEFKYFYSKNILNIKDTELCNDAVIQYVGEGDLKVFLVFVYLNDKGEKIRHNILDIDSMSKCYIPPLTSKIKVGIKIQGKGTKSLKEISLFKNDLSIPLFNTTTLILSKFYPSYDDLYKNGFIHQRMKEYERLGRKYDFFEYSNESTELLYREFFGINVISGNINTLKALLNLGYIKNLGIHFPYPDILESLQPYFNKLSISLWFHGAEIDSWKDREYEFEDKTCEQIQKIKNIRDGRQKYYREFLPSYSRFNYIFVSSYFRNRVLCNLSIHPKKYYHVIHNYINQKLFQFKSKEIDDFKKILVIRPFASACYANDITRDCILELSKSSIFDSISFDIYGDGKLFEKCTDSIKKFKNVHLHRTFLPQNEIALLHKKYGIMLVPTRADTQGVSRDEAMSSGLVVITTNVGAIPEFTDNKSAIVVAKDDFCNMAKRVVEIYENPNKYLEMSLNAHRKVEQLCSFNNTILKEYNLLNNRVIDEYISVDFSKIEVVIYCDVNPNIFDGSSIWLNSVASIISRDYKTLVVVKNDLNQNMNVIMDIIDNDNLIILEPKHLKYPTEINQKQVYDILSFLEEKCCSLQGLVIRGYDIAYSLAKENKFNNKMYTYFSAFYKNGDTSGFSIPCERHEQIRLLFCYSKKILFQTKFIAQEFLEFYKAPLNYSILPPAVPDDLLCHLTKIELDDKFINIGYAGKFYPNWGIEELVDWSENLIKKGYKIQVHLVISKYFNSIEYKKIIDKYVNRDFVTLYTSKNRFEALSLMNAMDFVWCWRPHWFEFSTLEYSMKLIENLYCHNRCIMQPSKVNLDLAGENYEYFIKNEKEFIKLLKKDVLKDGFQNINFIESSIKRFVLSNINIM